LAFNNNKKRSCASNRKLTSSMFVCTHSITVRKHGPYREKYVAR
jgi:hypothetical protein